MYNNTAQFSQRLVDWYRANKKILPWRENVTPYSTWISEIMLQQTVVTTVIPYFKKWMDNYPGIDILEKASEENILRLWEGLGYYSRAQNILKTARILASQYACRIPDNYLELIKLPGIGEYTASAILSIAFHQRVPLIDANVRRIGQRLFNLPEWTKPARQTVQDFFEKTIPAESPGDFNQGLMELGQTICTKSGMKCHLCPVISFCQAKKADNQHNIPVLKKKAIIHKSSLLLIFLLKYKIYVCKPKIGVLKNLWGFPRIGLDIQTECRSQIETILHQYNFNKTARIKTHNHFYTKYKDTLYPYICFLSSENEIPDPFKKLGEGRWISHKQIIEFPFPSIYRKIFKNLQKLTGFDFT